MSRKKRKLFISIMCICYFLLTSCNYKTYIEQMSEGQSRYEEIADTIINAIIQKDKGYLKSVFSSKVCEEKIDLDNSIDELFNFIEGNIEGCEIIPGTATYSSKRSLKAKIQYESEYEIITDKCNYSIVLLYTYQDDFDPDNVGLHQLRILKSDTDPTPWKNDTSPGILIME